MAKWEGENKTVYSVTVVPGVMRAEVYYNLCDKETAMHEGIAQYHGILHLVDHRGGIEVTVMSIPLMNPDSDNGHFTDADDVISYVKDTIDGFIETMNDSIANGEIGIGLEAAYRVGVQQMLLLENLSYGDQNDNPKDDPFNFMK